MGFLNESKTTEIENYIERYDDYGPDWADFPHFKEQKSEKNSSNYRLIFAKSNPAKGKDMKTLVLPGWKKIIKEAMVGLKK